MADRLTLDTAKTLHELGLLSDHEFLGVKLEHEILTRGDIGAKFWPTGLRLKAVHPTQSFELTNHYENGIVTEVTVYDFSIKIGYNEEWIDHWIRLSSDDINRPNEPLLSQPEARSLVNTAKTLVAWRR